MLKNKPLAILLCMIAAMLTGSLTFGLRAVRATSLPFVFEYSAADLGTGAVEISAVTYNGQRDRLVLLDNADSVVLHEVDVDPTTGRPASTPRRTIELVDMGGDVEGLTWMHDDTYAVIDENTGLIHVFTIPEGASDSAVFGSPGSSIATGIVENSGFGAEGLTYLPDHNGRDWFLAVDEEPTSVLAIATDGTNRSSTILSTPNLSDFSGVYMSPVDGMLYIVSDVSAMVGQFQPDETLMAFTEVANQPLGAADLRQAEGLTFNPSMTYMYVVGETETNLGNGFGLWAAPVVIAPVATSPAPATEDSAALRWSDAVPD